ncbi:MAG: patatin-like phospholipase family protein [Acidimicrobiales bacterium]
MTVGLVLGAGGPLGWAYHLGVIEGLREAVGHEPAMADRIVGTSAGGAIAASLLAGANTNEVLEAITRPPTAEEMATYEEASAKRKGLRRLRPLAPSLILKLGPRGGATALAGLLPEGVFPTASLRRFPTAGLDQWPERLWMPSVRLDDGKVVVFGRDRTDVSVSDAIEATAAVPGLFQPKMIGEHRFLDGAVASATHAHLLVDDGHRMVLVSSPMTRPGRGVLQLRAARQLRTEVDALERAGTDVVVVGPDAAIMATAQGFPRKNPNRGHAIVAAAKAQVVRALS